MSTDPASQSLNISGGHLANVQVAQAGGDIHQTQDMRQGVPDVPTAEAVTRLLEQLEALVQQAGLPPEQQGKALKHLETVKEEAVAAEPDKGFALKSFQRATQVLKEADTLATTGHSLWDQINPIVAHLAPWFGVAAKALLLL